MIFFREWSVRKEVKYCDVIENNKVITGREEMVKKVRVFRKFFGEGVMWIKFEWRDESNNVNSEKWVFVGENKGIKEVGISFKYLRNKKED